MERSLIYCTAHKIQSDRDNPEHTRDIFHKILLQRWQEHFAQAFPDLESSKIVRKQVHVLCSLCFEGALKFATLLVAIAVLQAVHRLQACMRQYFMQHDSPSRNVQTACHACQLEQPGCCKPDQSGLLSVRSPSCSPTYTVAMCLAYPMMLVFCVS